MTDAKFETRIAELTAEIAAMPEVSRARLMALLDETVTRHESIQMSTARARESLDDWRLILKYRVFDMEAQAREAAAAAHADDLTEDV